MIQKVILALNVKVRVKAGSFICVSPALADWSVSKQPSSESYLCPRLR